MSGGLIATFTVAPAFSALLLPERVRETETLLMRALHRFYSPALVWTLGSRRTVVAVSLAPIVAAGLGVRTLGLEILPKLEEGNIWVRATMRATISMNEGNRYVNDMRKLIAGFPEVETDVSQHGRPDDGPTQLPALNAV